MKSLASSGEEHSWMVCFASSVPLRCNTFQKKVQDLKVCSPQMIVGTSREAVTDLRVSYEKAKPNWAGDTPLSKLVSALVSMPLVRSALKVAARQVAINIAEKNGISWRQRITELEKLIPLPKRQDLLNSVQDLSVAYPDYYLKPFHAYDDGNLGWLQAFEIAPSTKYVCLRTVQTDNHGIDAVGAYDEMYSSFFKALRNAAPSGWLSRPAFNALDNGCSVGLSTRDVARRLLANGVDVAHVEGIDLSPYFLAFASVDSSPLGSDHTNVEHLVSFRHANAEETKVESSTLDLVTFQFVIHELPTHAVRTVLEEAFRILKPNSMLGVFDMDPQSSIIQNLTPVLFTFSKCTEPYIDQYFNLDLVGLLKETGFINVKCVKTDPRSRAIVATKL